MEPTMHDIEDYNGNESSQKRKTVNMVIVGLFILGFTYGLIKEYDNLKPMEIYTPTYNK
jgi:hypothetical protein